MNKYEMLYIIDANLTDEAKEAIIAKFENSVKPGGLLIYDPNGIINPPTRKDINI